MKEKLSNIPKAVKIAVPVAVVAVVAAVLIICGVFSSKTEVPDVVKMSMENAQKILEKNGLTFFVEDTVMSNDVDENTVMSQNPKAGEKVAKNTSVGVVVSIKAYETEIPDVTDFSKELAIERLEAAGVKVDVAEEFSDTVPAGTVISQSIKGKAKSSDTVKIVVSKGAENSSKKADLKSVPNVVSKNVSDAKKALNDKGIGLTVVSEEYNDTVKKGEIISQKTNEETGAVEVVVSRGSRKDTQVVVPSVVYRTQSDAKKLLESNGLQVVVEEKASDTVSKGAVISQSVKPGTKVTAGSKITIVVSTGKDQQTTTQATTTAAAGKTTTTTTTTKKNQTTTTTTTKAPASTTQKPTTTERETTTSYDKAAEKQYVADFKITTDKASAKAGDEIKVSVALKTNYRIFTVMVPVIYDGDVFEMQNTSDSQLSSFLTFEGSLAKTYKTNGNWKSPAQMYSRNNNESYWTKSDVMKKWKIAFASWAVDASVSQTPVMLSNEEVIVSFTLKVKSDVKSTDGRIFISPDFQKTSDCVKGILAVGRCKNETVDLNFVDRDQTIKVDRADVKVKIQ